MSPDRLAGRRALIVFNEGLGNIVVVTPIMGAWTRSEPGVRYALLGQSGADSLPAVLRLSGQVSAEDAPIIWRRFAPRDAPLLLDYLREHRFNLLVNLRKQDPALDGDYFVFRRAAAAAGVDCWDLYELPPDVQGRPIGEQVVQLLRLHGVRLPHLRTDFLGRSCRDVRPGVVGCFVGASKGVKRWPAWRWQTTLDEVQRRFPAVQLELTTGISPTESRLLADILAGREASWTAVDLPTPTELIDWVAGLSALITGDTVAAHIGAAVGCPTVALYISTLASVWAPRARPDRFRAVQSEIAVRCRGMKIDGTCTRYALGCPAPCRGGISTGAVTDALAALAGKALDMVGTDGDPGDCPCAVGHG